MQRTIYALIDPRTKKVRYVGCTNDLDRRLWEHLNNPPSSRPQIQKWLLELDEAQLAIVHVVLDKTDREDHAEEQRWIKHYQALGEADLNYSIGGGHLVTPATRAKQSASAVEAWKYRRRLGQTNEIERSAAFRKRCSENMVRQWAERKARSANTFRKHVSESGKSSGGSTVSES
jgi:hypothetical protein